MFLLLSLVPLSIIGAIAYKNGKDTIERNLGSGFHQIAHATINNVDRFLYGINRDIHTWSHLVLMQEVIIGDVDGKISSLLSGLNAEYGYFSMINVINLNGEVVASSNHELIGMDASYEEGYVHAMDLEPFVEDLKFDDIAGDWVVNFSVPIIAKFEENKIIGMIFAKLNANELFNLTQNKEMEISGEYYSNHIHGKIILMKNDGLIISDDGRSAGVLFRRNLIDDGLKSASLACRKKQGYIIEMNESRLSIIGYDHSMGYRDFPGLGWAVLVIEETETAFAPILRLKIMIFGLAAIVSMIIIIISIIIARKMSNPILKIADVAKKVSHGDFDVRVDYETTDEVGSLIRTFNHMIEAIITKPCWILKIYRFFK